MFLFLVSRVVSFGIICVVLSVDIVVVVVGWVR